MFFQPCAMLKLLLNSRVSQSQRFRSLTHGGLWKAGRGLNSVECFLFLAAGEADDGAAGTITSHSTDADVSATNTSTTLSMQPTSATADVIANGIGLHSVIVLWYFY